MSGPFCACWSASGGAPFPPGRAWDSRPPPRVTCRCAEDGEAPSWRWLSTGGDDDGGGGGGGGDVELSDDGREVTFHRRYSSGTAAVVGSRPLDRDLLHYWEIKVLTELYGTDVMIGAGTARVDFAAGRYQFASFLGLDRESYGLSYTGAAQHGGAVARRCKGFGKGSVVGVYLDMWRGTLRYYVNRRPVGVSFDGLRRHSRLYPMVSSTASQSAVRLVYSMSAPASLSVLCARTLRPESLPLRVPGFRSFFRAAFWILLPDEDPGEETFDDKREASFWKNCNSRKTTNVVTEPTPPPPLPNPSLDIPDDELWAAALEPTLGDAFVQFSTRLTETACERCRTRTAVVSVEKKQSKMCVECFRDARY